MLGITVSIMQLILLIQTRSRCFIYFLVGKIFEGVYSKGLTDVVRGGLPSNRRDSKVPFKITETSARHCRCLQIVAMVPKYRKYLTSALAT